MCITVVSVLVQSLKLILFHSITEKSLHSDKQIPVAITQDWHIKHLSSGKPTIINLMQCYLQSVSEDGWSELPWSTPKAEGLLVMALSAGITLWSKANGISDSFFSIILNQNDFNLQNEFARENVFFSTSVKENARNVKILFSLQCLI